MLAVPRCPAPLVNVKRCASTSTEDDAHLTTAPGSTHALCRDVTPPFAAHSSTPHAGGSIRPPRHQVPGANGPANGPATGRSQPAWHGGALTPHILHLLCTFCPLIAAGNGGAAEVAICTGESGRSHRGGSVSRKGHARESWWKNR